MKNQKKVENSNVFDFSNKNVYFKPLNVLVRNQKRLEQTTPRDALNEVVKNAIEHGDGRVTITFVKNNSRYMLVCFNNMHKKALQSINFTTLLKNLTTFEHRTTTNFHEGLTTLLLFKAMIRTGKYFIKNRQSEDKFYQYIENASHYINDKYEEVIITKSKEISGWEVTLFDLSQELEKTLIECLNSFHFLNPNNFNIKYNDNLLKLNRFALPTNRKIINIHGKLYFSIKLLNTDKNIEERDEVQSPGIEIFWKLAHVGVYQKLPFSLFSNSKIKGTVILTSIHQFANEKRIELNSDIQEFLHNKIQELNALGSKEQFLESELEKYSTFKSNYIKWFQKILEIPKNKVEILLLDSEPEKSLLDSNNFIHTLTRILTLSEEYKVELPLLFIHPTENTRLLSEEEFIRVLNKIEYPINQFRAKYKLIPIGIKILNGEPEGFLQTGNLQCFMKDKENLVKIDAKIPFHKIIEFDNDELILYPINPYFNYLVYDYSIKDINSPKEYVKSSLISKEIIQDLKDFVINNTGKILTSIETNHIDNKDGNRKDPSKPTTKKLMLPFKGSQYYIKFFQDENLDGIHQRLPVLIRKKNGDIDTPYSFKFDLTSKSNGISESKLDIFQIYKGIHQGVKLLIENDSNFPKKPVYPVIFNENNNERAKYFKDYGIIAFNLHYFPIDIQDPIIIASRVLDIISHELAHEYAPNHGRAHERFLERYLLISKELDIQSNKIITYSVAEYFKL